VHNRAACGLEPVFSMSATVSPPAGPACAADHGDGRERRSERFYADLTATDGSGVGGTRYQYERHAVNDGMSSLDVVAGAGFEPATSGL
jgi:hypothetical protein